MNNELDFIAFTKECLDIKYDKPYLFNRDSAQKFIDSLGCGDFCKVSNFCGKVIREYVFPGKEKTGDFFEKLDMADLFYWIWFKSNCHFSQAFVDTFGNKEKEIQYNFPLRKIIKDVAKIFSNKDFNAIIGNESFIKQNSFGMITLFQFPLEILNYNTSFFILNDMCNNISSSISICIESNYTLIEEGKEEFIFGLYLLYRNLVLKADKRRDFDSIYGSIDMGMPEFLNKLNIYKEDLEILIQINSRKTETA